MAEKIENMEKIFENVEINKQYEVEMNALKARLK